ncbi:MAG: hypothetical protein QXS93_00130 [Candidatus Micrarchaeia archaeon]
MVSDQLINTIIGIYSNQPLLLAMQLINMLIALIIAKSLIEYAIQLQGRSLSRTMRFLAYAFLIMAGIMVIRVLSALPWFPWDPVEEIAIAFFLFATAYAVWTMKESIQAYSQLKNRR